MRTTLTLDDDVASSLERLQKTHERTFKDLVNEALRRGLAEMLAPSKPRPRFETRVVDLGPCKLGSLDDVAEALAIADGESFK